MERRVWYVTLIIQHYEATQMEELNTRNIIYFLVIEVILYSIVRWIDASFDNITAELWLVFIAISCGMLLFALLYRPFPGIKVFETEEEWKAWRDAGKLKDGKFYAWKQKK